MAKPFKPKPHQQTITRWLLRHSRGAVFADPGMGKTAAVLQAFQALKKAGTSRGMIVVAPRRVCHNVWSHESGVGELDVWSTFHDLTVALVHGPKKEVALETPADLYVMTFEGLTWLASGRCRGCGRDKPTMTKRGRRTVTACCEEGLVDVGRRLKDLTRRGVDTLTIDELSRYKHARAQRSRSLRPWLSWFRRRWGLTGDPAPNGLIDLFGQLLVIDGGEALGPYVTHYRNKYFYPTGFGGYTWKLQDGAAKKIYKVIKPVTLAMRAEDHLDMPTLVERDLWVDLNPKARKAYDAMEEDLVALLDDDLVTAANAAVASAKCRQLASGGVYTADHSGRKVLHVHHEKTEALKELVEELQGSPLLVAYEFDHDYDRICAGLKREVPVLRGGVTDRQASRIIAAWNEGELPVLCGHPLSMAHGLNLQRAGNHVAWYSLTWDYELYDQLVRRVYRQGQGARRVFVHRILARNTVDTAVAAALKSKRGGQNALLEALKRRRRGLKK